MTSIAITVPLLRTSLVHIPRRDLVLGGGDSLSLAVTVVGSDRYDAAPIELSGGLGGPMLTLFIWPSGCWPRSWDYGAWWPPSSSNPLWSGDGVITDTVSATFTIAFPPGTMATWPRRCDWSMQLAWDHDAQVSQLACGNLHVMPSGQRLVAPTAIITSADEMMTTPSLSLVA